MDNIFDFAVVTGWFDQLLNGVMPMWLVTIIECLLVAVGLILVYALLALFYIYYERKFCGAIQCRLGPNRVGPMGLLQSFADMFKMLIKELIPINNIDKFLFNLAPYLVVAASLTAFAVLPWGKGLQIIDFNIGIFFLISVSSIGVLGILLAGWSSNNKFTLIGAMRSGAQMISYELSIGLSIMTMVMLAGTMNITGIVDEPWHFRYVGTEVSLDLRDSGLCLEEYLGAEPVTSVRVRELFGEKLYEETIYKKEEQK